MMKQNKITMKLLRACHIFAFGLPIYAFILLPFYHIFTNKDIMGENALSLLSLNINLLVMVWIVSVVVTITSFVIYLKIWLFKTEHPEISRNNLINLILWLMLTVLAVLNICSHYPVSNEVIPDIYQNLTNFWGVLHLFLLVVTGGNFIVTLWHNSKEFNQLSGINAGFQQAQKVLKGKSRLIFC